VGEVPVAWDGVTYGIGGKEEVKALLEQRHRALLNGCP
jgi:hypothetical protein